jgi:3-phosphoshikimate 1-carboxyvinyltransferase
MVAPYAASDVEVMLGGTVSSSPYIRMTLAVMSSFGVDVDFSVSNHLCICAGKRFAATDFTVETDASAASVFMAAAGIAGGEVEIPQWTKNSIQGDAGFAGLISRMGCEIEERDAGLRVRGNGSLMGIDADMNAMPDCVPPLVVAALFAGSSTRIRNVGHLRYKESDRLCVMETELRKLGAAIVVNQDSIEVTPAQLHGALLDPCDDHRMAMSFALAGLRIPGVRIGNPGCVKKSFPDFWVELRRVCAGISS